MPWGAALHLTRHTCTKWPSALFNMKPPIAPARIVTFSAGLTHKPSTTSLCSHICPLSSSNAEMSGRRAITRTTLASKLIPPLPDSARSGCSLRICRASKPTSLADDAADAGAGAGPAAGTGAGAARTFGVVAAAELVGASARRAAGGGGFVACRAATCLSKHASRAAESCSRAQMSKASGVDCACAAGINPTAITMPRVKRCIRMLPELCGGGVKGVRSSSP